MPAGMHDGMSSSSGKSNKDTGSNKGKGRDLDYQMHGGKTGSTFETYKDGKNIGVDNELKKAHGTTQQKKEAQKALDKGNYYSPGANAGFFNKASIANSNFQRRQNIKLAQKRALQKYKALEKYIHGDFDMDYDFTVDIYGNKVPKGLEFLTSNQGTSIESKRKNLYDVNDPMYGFIGAAVNTIRPNTQVTLENTLNKARAYNKLSTDPNISKEKLDALKNLGKTPDQIEGGGGGGNESQPYILPIDYNTGAATTEVLKPYTNDFDYRFGTGQNIGRDVTLGYAANGGRITRAGGGIMNAIPRQGYFLGKIVKGVKKVVGGVAKAAGKVLSSDVGKMALAAGAFYYGGGGGMPKFLGGKGLGGFSPTTFFSKSNPLLFNADKTLSLGKLGLASAALPFLMPPAKPNEDIGMADRGGRLLDSKGNEVLPAGIRAEINEAYESGDPEKIKAIEQYYAFLPPTEQYLPYSDYGSQGYRTTVATGGRIKAQEGGLMNLGGMEKDYRAEGGFVPIGKAEKADDVPARLSVNEFVFTADAVRNAGGGDIDKGAEVMENMMKNLENGGRVSEESQGNTGAQNMFSVSERIGEVI